MVPLNCGVCLLWLGLDQWLLKVSWLGELVSVFLCVELDLFTMECSEVSSCDFWLYMGLVWLWAAHLLMFRVVFLFYWRISMVCLSLELAVSWEELGFSVGMETFAWAFVY